MKLELKGITKRFGPLVANNDINLTIEEGHIHALLGENGAGKSTLMNVLYGLHQPDEGEILIDGKPVHFNGPGDAVAAGIGMVHQHFMLIPVFTVAESIALVSISIPMPSSKTFLLVPSSESKSLRPSRVKQKSLFLMNQRRF